MNAKLEPLGECAVTIRWGSVIDEQLNKHVLLAMEAIEESPFTGFQECVPAYASLTVYYDPMKIVKDNGSVAYPFVCAAITKRLEALQGKKGVDVGKIVEIPVCYEGEFAPDLPVVAEHNKLTIEEVIDIHTNKTYLVYMIGFAPGFPYLGGLDVRIATPRRSSPRLKVAPGSVGIAGKQTGIYPLEMPGGWQIIGRTPVPLFTLEQKPPSLFTAGDSIKFVPISREEYGRISI